MIKVAVIVYVNTALKAGVEDKNRIGQGKVYT